MIPFLKNADGTLAARFTPVEAELLSTMAAQMIALLGEVATVGNDPLPGLVIGGTNVVSTDPAIARLLPNAYADDAASSEFRQLTERGLAARKVANAQFVIDSLDASVEGSEAGAEIELDAAGAGQWMRAMGDIRLVIAARLGIVDEESEVEQDDESLALLDVFDWVAGVQDSLVRNLP